MRSAWLLGSAAGWPTTRSLCPTATDIVISPAEHELSRTYTDKTACTLTGKEDELEIPAAGGLPREWVTTTYNTVGLPDRTFGVRGDGDPSNYISASEYSPYGEPLRMTVAAADSSANMSVGFRYYEARPLEELNPQRVKCFRIFI